MNIVKCIQSYLFRLKRVELVLITAFAHLPEQNISTRRSLATISPTLKAHLFVSMLVLREYTVKYLHVCQISC